MEFCTFASGSSGNCALVSHGGTNILIDAGISLRRIKTALSSVGLTADMISGVILTHEHSDHTKALMMIEKYHRLPVYATYGTLGALSKEGLELSDTYAFHAGGSFKIGSFEITSFKTPHDTPESVGYTLTAGGRTLSFATDMGYVPQGVYDCVKGSDAVVLESNHDIGMLKSGSYPYYLKRRILSATGHLSNFDCGNLAAALVREGTRNIVLAHLSRENNTPELAYKTVMDAIEKSGAGDPGGFSLNVAGANEPSPLFCV